MKPKIYCNLSLWPLRNYFVSLIFLPEKSNRLFLLFVCGIFVVSGFWGGGWLGFLFSFLILCVLNMQLDLCEPFTLKLRSPQYFEGDQM